MPLRVRQTTVDLVFLYRPYHAPPPIARLAGKVPMGSLVTMGGIFANPDLGGHKLALSTYVVGHI